jgi:TonB-dependent SusC/RagA subfamily outer membrane receptor
MRNTIFLSFIISLFIAVSVSGQDADSSKIAKEKAKSEKQAAKKKKKAAQSEIPAEKPNRYAKYSNMYDLFRAEFPEIQITGNTILIRGHTSITGSSEPLIVVDGVITSNVEDVMPSNVRSVKVLKGQQAAIYGMRGGNGVIEIVTISTQGVK